MTYTVTDDSGNTATCSFTITVEDNEDPTFTVCAADATVDTDPDVCTYDATTAYDVTVDDNCTVSSTTWTTLRLPPIAVPVRPSPVDTQYRYQQRDLYRHR